MGVFRSFVKLLMVVECMLQSKVIKKVTMLTNECLADPIHKVDCQHHYARMPPKVK